MRHIVIVAIVATMAAAGAALSAAAPHTKAQGAPTPQDPPAPQVLGTARPLTIAEAAKYMSGNWKLNPDLSPLPRAGTSPAAGAVPDRGNRGGGGGRGGGGRGGTPLGAQAQAQQQLRVRALYRELTVRPQTLSITATTATVTFIDDDGTERLVAANNRKEKLDLGTAIVECKAWWDGAALTLELDAGSSVKLYEIFELSPTRRQMLVTLKTPETSADPKPGELRGHLQRVYDRVGETNGSDIGVLQRRPGPEWPEAR